jgi:hypothetical protein
MPDKKVATVAEETAYDFNSQVPALALIAKGGSAVPPGKWIRVGDSTAHGRRVAGMLLDLFPSPKGRVITSASEERLFRSG